MTANSFTEEELDDIYAFAVQLGKDAGKLLLEAAQSRFDGNSQRTEELVEKDSSVDIVTKTDEGEPCHAALEPLYFRSTLSLQMTNLPTDVEAFIKTSIANRYPNHA
jgi:myo-inositol-1(or 4)-monophosphatase